MTTPTPDLHAELAAVEGGLAALEIERPHSIYAACKRSDRRGELIIRRDALRRQLADLEQ